MRAWPKLDDDTAARELELGLRGGEIQAGYGRWRAAMEYAIKRLKAAEPKTTDGGDS